MVTLTNDPRGPMRMITAVEPRIDCTRVTFDCGHTSSLNGTFHYKIGADCRCFHCGPCANAEPLRRGTDEWFAAFHELGRD